MDKNMFQSCLKTLRCIRKTFDESEHPRDEKGRWCGNYTATDASGRKYSFVPDRVYRDSETFVPVVVDVDKVDASFAKDGTGMSGNYIPPGGEGKRGCRAGFERWVDTPSQEPIAMSVLGLKVHSDREIQFLNGRHRFSVLRDRGVKTMPVMTFRDGAEEFRRRFGV